MQHQDDTAGGEVGENAPLTVASMKMLHCRVSSVLYCPGYLFPFLLLFFSQSIIFPGRLLIELRPVGQSAGREPWCSTRESRVKQTRSPGVAS